MSVGEALAQARIRAGLSVEEVSMRTRIRATVISAMEKDDYEACGGAIYVNGYIRAVAAAIGIDPLPLIRGYAEGSKVPAPGPAGRVPATRNLADTVVDLPRVGKPQDPDPALTPPHGQAAPPGRAADHPRPRRVRDRRRVRWEAALAAVVLLVALGFAGREIIPGMHRGRLQSAAAANSVPTHPSQAPSAPSPVRSRAATPVAPRPAAVRSLAPVKATAFGPAGTSDGDNPGTAYRALGGQGRGWLSEWYTTSAFGALKKGTGLLVDMGAVVSITSVSARLGRLRGAIIELRAGDEPVTSALHVVKQVTDAGGRVIAPLPAVKARYLLIWFTKLPPDGSGTYRANIDGIAVRGYR